jgi:large subunit ribosomal protein L9
MARRKEILLVQDVLKLGNMGDVVRVSPGYARNYLFPYGLAIPADGAAKRQIDVLREKAAKSEVERETKANVLKKTMEGMSIQIASRVAHADELFGSIGTKDIVNALAKSGVSVDGKQVHLHDKIRKLGRYQIEVRLHRNVEVIINLEVVNSDPNAPSLDETLAAVAAEHAAKAKAKDKDKTAAPEAEAGATPDAKDVKATDAKAETGGKAEGGKSGKPEGGKAGKAKKSDSAKPEAAAPAPGKKKGAAPKA